MSENLTQEDLHQVEVNEQILMGSEQLGTELADIYRSAIELDPRLAEDVKIVPLDPDSERYAFARTVRDDNGELSHYEVHLKVEDMDQVLQSHQDSLDKIPGFRDIVANLMKCEPEQVTPEAIHVFTLAHELGHISDFLDANNDPTLLQERARQKQEEFAAIPLAKLATRDILTVDSSARKYIEENWSDISTTHQVASLEELLEKRTKLYRATTAEAFADNFAADVFANEPLTVEKLLAEQEPSSENQHSPNSITEFNDGERIETNITEDDQAWINTAEDEVIVETKSGNTYFICNGMVINKEQRRIYPLEKGWIRSTIGQSLKLPGVGETSDVISISKVDSKQKSKAPDRFEDRPSPFVKIRQITERTKV